MVFPVIKKLLSFNFKYFDGSQSAGQSFTAWTKEQLEKLFEKLKWYSQSQNCIGKKHLLVIADSIVWKYMAIFLQIRLLPIPSMFLREFNGHVFDWKEICALLVSLSIRMIFQKKMSLLRIFFISYFLMLVINFITVTTINDRKY